MRHKFLLFIIFFSLIFLLTACSIEDANQDFVDDLPNQDAVALELSNQLNRKIIYEISAQIYTDNLDDTYQTILNKVYADEWFDSQSFYTNSLHLVIRIKTENLNDFIMHLNEHFALNNYLYKATDISLAYQNAEHKIESLLSQRARLVILYDQSSLSDMITINQRLSEIDIELGKLQGTINTYDSLIEYSTVTLTIYKKQTIASTGFGQQIIDGFSDGFNALFSFMKGFVLVIVHIFPFALLITPITYFGMKWYKTYQKKVKKNLEKVKSESSSKL